GVLPSTGSRDCDVWIHDSFAGVDPRWRGPQRMATRFFKEANQICRSHRYKGYLFLVVRISANSSRTKR
ncbi:unnamed protein product, partial [Linum tenue]